VQARWAPTGPEDDTPEIDADRGMGRRTLERVAADTQNQTMKFPMPSRHIPRGRPPNSAGRATRRRPLQLSCALGDTARAVCLSDPRRLAAWPAGCASCMLNGSRDDRD
jgi:hypothetical protein